MLTLIAETIEWHRDPADLPDAETTVLIELDPALDYSEPVFVGYYGDGEWRDVHGEVVTVIAWANIPKGTAGVAVVHLSASDEAPQGEGR